MERNPVREAAIASAIRGRLMNDKRVGDLPVTYIIMDRDVYLIGRVETLEQQDIVEFIVRGTPGVGRVNADELEVAELANTYYPGG
jgi:osmotically-inducible protein OsmY